jgi:hypothetical protein
VPEGNSPLTYTVNFALGTVDKVPGNAALPWRNGAPVNGQVAGSSDALHFWAGRRRGRMPPVQLVPATLNHRLCHTLPPGKPLTSKTA